MIFSSKRKSFRQVFCLLFCLFLLPCSSLASSMEVEEISTAPSLPLDFSFGSVPREDALSETKDEAGNPVLTYEDSTIRAVVTKTAHKKTTVWIADIVISDPSQLRTASAVSISFNNANDREYAVNTAQHVNAVVAMNGDSWGVKNEKHNLGCTFRQGQLISARLSDRDKWAMDLLLIDENGDFHGLHRAKDGDLPDPSEFEGHKISNIFAFGPILVENGEAVADFHGAQQWMNMAWQDHTSRIALCQVDKLHYKIIVTAGKFRGDAGITLTDFAEYVASQGVRFAYNLDGGVSSMLYLHGYDKINSKDHPEHRMLWDIIYFASAESAGNALPAVP